MLNNKGTYIIAEAGVNHNGDLKLAKELIDIAADAGVDAIKFQTFIAEELISVNAKQAEYQAHNTGITESQLEMVKKLELSQSDFEELYKYSNDKNITFLSTAFDLEGMDFLIKKCHIPLVKIPSGELTNSHYLFNMARYKLPIILSTGMATLEEIERAVAIIFYGWVNDTPPLSLQQCLDFYKTDEDKNALKGNLTILHCVTEYPAPYEDTNLNAMKTIANKFNCPTGLSDHSLGIHIPIAAVAMGAKIIEKHFTIDKNMQGPDHKASLNPEELKEMVKCVKDIEKAMGDGNKSPKNSEIKNIPVARRSIVAGYDLTKGEKYTNDNIKCKRPGDGVSAIFYWDYLGKECPYDVKKDNLVK